MNIVPPVNSRIRLRDFRVSIHISIRISAHQRSVWVCEGWWLVDGDESLEARASYPCSCVTLSTPDTEERQRQDYGAPQITAETSQLWHYINAYGQLFLLVPTGIKLSSTFVFDSFAEIQLFSNRTRETR